MSAVRRHQPVSSLREKSDKFLCFDSGVSRWINPLPDIALHTLQVVEETDWPASLSSSPTRELIIKSRRCHKRVALNVGGVRHEVTWRLLDQFPHSRLGRLARVESHQQIMDLVSYYDLRSNEYFFDR